MKIPCYFCQTELEAKQIADNVYQAFCPVCPEIVSTRYVVSVDGKPEFSSAGIFFQDGDKEYRANYCEESFYIDTFPKVFLDINGKFLSKRVMSLSFSPKNIGPHNIKQKFQTLKVWS